MRNPTISPVLNRVLETALQRFEATRNIQDVSTTAHALCDAESERLDSELSMVRYIAWAIPSIGFLGTVRGIGEARMIRRIDGRPWHGLAERRLRAGTDDPDLRHQR